MRFKIKIDYETEIDADNIEDALENFWDNQLYQHDLGTFIDDNLTAEEIEVDELKEVVVEKIKKIKNKK